MSARMEWVRKTYGVPAKRGVRVEYTGEISPQIGTITSAKDGYIRVRMDGDNYSGIYHPTWEMRYLSAEGNT